MCSVINVTYRTMFVLTVLVLVSAVGANLNSTNEVIGRSRMAWMKALLDHHSWGQFIANNSVSLPSQCENDLRTYITALNTGQLWASKSKYCVVSSLLKNKLKEIFLPNHQKQFLGSVKLFEMIVVLDQKSIVHERSVIF